VTALVAVTGASGFVGRALSTRLVRDGHTVQALVRDKDRVVATGTEPRVVPHLTDLDAVRGAIAGCECVFHVAGLAHQADDGGAAAMARSREGIVTPTATLLDAMQAEGTRSLVMVSSIAAVCTTHSEPITDATPAQPESGYGRAKLEADRLALRRADASGFAAVVLRPPALYGPGMKGNPLRLFRLVWRGVPLPVGAVHNRRSMMSVGNFIETCTAAWTSGLRGAYLVADRPAHSTAEWTRRIAAALGVRPRLVSVPPALLRLGARVVALGSYAGVPVAAEQFDRLLGSVEIVDDAFRQALPRPLPEETEPEALARAAAWFRESGRAS